MFYTDQHVTLCTDTNLTWYTAPHVTLYTNPHLTWYTAPHVTMYTYLTCNVLHRPTCNVVHRHTVTLYTYQHVTLYTGPHVTLYTDLHVTLFTDICNVVRMSTCNVRHRPTDNVVHIPAYTSLQAHRHVVGMLQFMPLFLTQTNRPCPFVFYSVLVFVSVFMTLPTVFHSINFPDNSPPVHFVLLVFFLPYWSFKPYISV